MLRSRSLVSMPLILCWLPMSLRIDGMGIVSGARALWLPVKSRVKSHSV
jgi:hypothetical protein